MNTNDPTNGALDPDERELARVLRALPSGEPPAALDARILRAAADAAASAPARRRRALGLFGGGSALWGIGTAAAAVLALGIGWQAMYGHQPLLPRSSPVALPADAASDDSVSVEFRDRTSLADKAGEAAGAPPPPPPALADREFPRLRSRAPGATRVAPAAAAAPAAPAPEAFPEAGLDEHVAARAEAGAAADAVAANAADAAFATEREAPPGAAVQRRAEAAETASLSAKAAQSAGVVAQRAEADRADRTQSNQAQAEPAQAGDAVRMRPANWLAQVRSLRAAGKNEQARARLVEFHKAYPHWVIPTDLAPLLDE
jgi:hypothetical protein